MAEEKQLEELMETEEYKSLMNISVAGGGGSKAEAVEETVEEPVQEQTQFDIYLQSFDAKQKLTVIKEVRAILGLGLKDVSL